MSGSGPGGRILKQDVESFTPQKIEKTAKIEKKE